MAAFKKTADQPTRPLDDSFYEIKDADKIYLYEIHWRFASSAQESECKKIVIFSSIPPDHAACGTMPLNGRFLKGRVSCS